MKIKHQRIIGGIVISFSILIQLLIPGWSFWEIVLFLSTIVSVALAVYFAKSQPENQADEPEV